MRENLDIVSREHTPLREEGVVQYEPRMSEDLHDSLFDQYMKQHLTDKFFEDLEDYFTFDEVDQMRKTLADYSDEEIIAAISIPHKLRDGNFEKFHGEVERGEKTPEEIIRRLIDVSKRYGFGVGYHTSPTDIKPRPDGEWFIKGTENDHRDSDLSRAYYSSKFKHLYKAKEVGYIYVVRTHPEDKTDGNWSRASTLSVIMRVPFREVHDYVTQTVAKIQKSSS